MKKLIIYLFLINAVSFTSGMQDSSTTSNNQDVPASQVEKNIVTSAGTTTGAKVKKASNDNGAKITSIPVQVKKNQVTKPAANTPASADSINISALVQSQLEAAQTGDIKSGVNYQAPEEKPQAAPVKVKVKAKKQEAGVFENLVISLNNFNKQYLNVTLFVAGTALIIGFFFGRKLLKVLFGQSKRNLKKSINLIRNEKPVYKQNKKLYELRSKLADSSNIYGISEKSIPGKARDMNLGEGEIMLAAKIKAVQLSKISK